MTPAPPLRVGGGSGAAGRRQKIMKTIKNTIIRATWDGVRYHLDGERGAQSKWYSYDGTEWVHASGLWTAKVQEQWDVLSTLLLELDGGPRDGEVVL